LKVIYNELGRSNRLAADLEKSQEDLRRKSFFLNAVSHDLRTPLNSLMLQANLVEVAMTTGDGETVQESLNEIKAGARAAATLLNTFLEYARLDWAGDHNSVDRVEMAVLLRDVLKQSAPVADEKSLYLRGNCPATLTIATDRAKLERILQNLIGNAIKFTDFGGVRVEMERAGPAIAIHVIDTGIGIPAEAMDHLFEEFFQTSNHERDRRKGFGLGLTIARRLAQQMGGDISVDSAVGKGSRFSVTLPGNMPQSGEAASISKASNGLEAASTTAG
jgi:signal transduction histidine kinase